MEKYLRLLNPKTTNYEAIPSGGHGSLTAADVCIAMSYAKLSPLQDNLVRLKYLGANTLENVELFAGVLLKLYSEYFLNKNVVHEYHITIIKVALYEFCMVAGDYKPTERNRELLSGFSDSTVRKHMKSGINRVVSDLNAEFELAQDKIFFQLNKSN